MSEQDIRAMLSADDGRIDLVAEAKAAQEGDAAPGAGAIKLIAPAKVNLFLGIGDVREDGYHEAMSIMHALALHDVLYMERLGAGVPAKGGAADGDAGAGGLAAGDAPSADVAAGGSETGLRVEVVRRAREGLAPLDVPPERNIVAKAVRRLAERVRAGAAAAGEDAAGASKTADGGSSDGASADAGMPDGGSAASLCGLSIIVEKHIPAEAGLGGGSADAAAALIGAARLWGIPADDARVEDVARELGADVAFFLHGGCACLVGVGDEFHHELVPMSKPVVLIKPEGGVSTAAAYRAFDECPQSIPAADAEAAFSAARAEDVPLRNNLVCASELLLPVLAEVRKWIVDRDDIEDALMSGSGSAVFAICRDFSSACRLAGAARAQGWWARTTTFGSARAAIVPATGRMG